MLGLPCKYELSDEQHAQIVRFWLETSANKDHWMKRTWREWVGLKKKDPPAITSDKNFQVRYEGKLYSATLQRYSLPGPYFIVTAEFSVSSTGILVYIYSLYEVGWFESHSLLLKYEPEAYAVLEPDQRAVNIITALRFRA